MQTFYDNVSFNATTDFNLKQALQLVVENLTAAEMLAIKTASPSGCTKGRLVYCLDGTYADKLAYGNGTDWVYFSAGGGNTGAYKPKSARAVATTNITTLSLAATPSIDGVTLAVGNIVLLTGQTSKSVNGCYIITGSGTNLWERQEDCNTWDELVSAMIIVDEGATYKDTQWLCIIDKGGTLGTTDIDWIQIPLMNDTLAGTGLDKTGNTINLTVDNSTIFVNGGDNAQVKIDPNRAITTSASGIGVNVDGTTVGIIGNALYVKNAFKAYKGYLNTATSGISGGNISHNVPVTITHGLGVVPMSIQFYVDDSGNSNVMNQVFPKVTAVTSTTLQVTFFINDVPSTGGAAVTTLAANKVFVSVIGIGAA
jgi:hypothetical protein